MNQRTCQALIIATIFFLFFVGCSDDDPVTPDPPSVGSIVVDPSPDILNAPWVLTGPDGYSKSSDGDQSLASLFVGDYTLAWGNVIDYVTPSGSTQTLVADGTITFSGTYVAVEETGMIIVNQTPDDLVGAGWSLSGPLNESGSGDVTLDDVAIGQYTLTWDAVDGYITPSTDLQTLVGGGTISFSGTYSEDPGYVQEFVLIPPTSVSMPAIFTMGSTVEDDETPHQVTLTGRFNMASTEVTNAQYVSSLQWAYDQGHVTATTTSVQDNLDGSTQELLNLDDPDCQIGFSSGVFSTSNPDRPVVEVSWHGSVAYCDWLSLQDGLPRAYDHDTWSCNGGNPYTAPGYRLPTEAEWEFACRAGTTTHFNTGDCLDAGTEANYRGSRPYTGCPSGPYLGRTSDVGSFPPNLWGLFDMHGNVWEWGNDWYGTYSGDETDPEGAVSGGDRVLRGGSRDVNAYSCRSANRAYYYPSSTSYLVGFRPVRSTQ